MEKLREKVKELRKKRGWAQEDIAQEMGVSLAESNGGMDCIVIRPR